MNAFNRDVVQIASGMVAGVVRDKFGPVAPFDTSLVLLMLGSAIVATQWGGTSSLRP